PPPRRRRRGRGRDLAERDRAPRAAADAQPGRAGSRVRPGPRARRAARGARADDRRVELGRVRRPDRVPRPDRSLRPVAAIEQVVAETPLSRLEALVDPGSLHLIRTAVGDGVVAASGRVIGRPVFCWAQDGRFKGGSLGAAGGETIKRVFALANRAGAPVVCFPESGGARVQEGAAGLAAYGAIFHAEATARVPVITVVAGACAGGAAYGAAVGDLTIAAGSDA